MFIIWRMRSKASGLLILCAVLMGVFALAAQGISGPLSVRLLRPEQEILPLQEVLFEASGPIHSGRVWVEPPASGTSEVRGRILSFRPTQPLRPGGVYTFYAEVIDATDRTVVENFSIRVGSRDRLWVYVKLDESIHWVYVYFGDELVKQMLASGGRPGDETPEGIFRIQNRGYHFWSNKYGQGAYFWVRLFGNYLFHSVPVDIHGKVIEEEAKRLGCPVSHGCIRLGMDDARWFYENVPDQTLVLIDQS